MKILSGIEMTDISTRRVTNKHGVTYTQIFHGDKHIANCFRTYHPTIPYEVFWDNSTKSARCNSIEGACQIVSKEKMK